MKDYYSDMRFLLEEACFMAHKKEEEKVVKVKNVKKDGKDMKKGKQIDKNTPSETPKPL